MLNKIPNLVRNFLRKKGIIRNHIDFFLVNYVHYQPPQTQHLPYSHTPHCQRLSASYNALILGTESFSKQAVMYWCFDLVANQISSLPLLALKEV